MELISDAILARRADAEKINLADLAEMAYDRDYGVRTIVEKRVYLKVMPAVEQVLSLPPDQWTFGKSEFIPQILSITLMRKIDFSLEQIAQLFNLMPVDKFESIFDAYVYKDTKLLMMNLSESHVIKLAHNDSDFIRALAIPLVPHQYLPRLLENESRASVIHQVLSLMKREEVPEIFMDWYNEIVVELMMDS